MTTATTTLWYLTDPECCPRCGARRQYNVFCEVIHARAGSVECPPEPFSEDPVMALIQALQAA